MDNKNTARLYISKNGPGLTVNRLNSYPARTEPIKIIKRKTGVILRYLQNGLEEVGARLPNISNFFSRFQQK